MVCPVTGEGKSCSLSTCFESVALLGAFTCVIIGTLNHSLNSGIQVELPLSYTYQRGSVTYLSMALQTGRETGRIWTFFAAMTPFYLHGFSLAIGQERNEDTMVLLPWTKERKEVMETRLPGRRVKILIFGWCSTRYWVTESTVWSFRVKFHGKNQWLSHQQNNGNWRHNSS
jgi:hypothetical protein